MSLSELGADAQLCRLLGACCSLGECGPTAGPFRTSVACGVPPELLGRMQKRERNRHHAVLRLLGPAHRDTLS